MHFYHIEGTDETPDILIDSNNGVMEITGCSTLKDVNLFYANIARWILGLSIGDKKIKTVNIKLSSINKPSAYWIKFILGRLNDASNDKETEITIYNNKNSRLLKDIVRECEEDYSIQIQYIAA